MRQGVSIIIIYIYHGKISVIRLGFIRGHYSNRQPPDVFKLLYDAGYLSAIRVQSVLHPGFCVVYVMLRTSNMYERDIKRERER